MGKRRRWEDIEVKQCKYCGHDIPRLRWMRPSDYPKTKYCTKSCSTSHAWTRRKDIPYFSKLNPKIKKPDVEELNRTFSEVRSFTKMAEIYEVGRTTIRRWMGKKDDLLNPPRGRY
jgi:hypothetical protein